MRRLVLALGGIAALITTALVVPASSHGSPVMMKFVAERSGGDWVVSAGSTAAAVAADDDAIIQLSPGAEVVMRMPDAWLAIPDGTTDPDLKIAVIDDLYPATATIYTSLDAVVWTKVVNAANSDRWPDTADIEVDLTGMVRYVKVVQDGSIDQTFPLAGFDLNAVAALHAGLAYEGSVEPRGLGYWKHNGLPARDCVNTSVDSASSTPKVVHGLVPGQVYSIEAEGTYGAGESIEADAMYSSRGGSAWTDSVSNYEFLGSALLDLQINGVSPNWGAFDEDHVYAIKYQPEQTQMALRVYDIHYPSNIGSLNVEVCPTPANAEIQAAIAGYKDSPLNRFVAQYGITVVNLTRDPELGSAIFFKTGNALSGKTVAELVLLGSQATTSTQRASLQQVFDWINNGQHIYSDINFES